MRVYPEKFAAALAGKHSGCIVISGDEPLLQQEALDVARQAATAAGVLERDTHYVGGKFNWNEFHADAGSMSLFASTSMKELILEKAPAKQVGEQLKAIVDSHQPGDYLLVSCPKLAKAQKQSAWYKAIDKDGLSLEIWPVKPAEMPKWVAGRASSMGLKLERAAVVALSQHCEGNLLAAKQALQKLQILHSGAVSEADVLQVVAESSKYSLYELIDSALAGNPAQTIKMMATLKAENVFPLIIANALAREVQSLLMMRRRIEQGEALHTVVASAGVWAAKKTLVQSALQRSSSALWQHLVLRCANLDQLCKGQAEGDAWSELSLCLALAAGARPFAAKSKRPARPN